MNIEIVKQANVSIAVLKSDELLLTDVQSALDLMATVQYEAGCSRIAIDKEVVSEQFFVLSTRLAGDILQKFVNYHVQLAIIGDFSSYTSKPLKDFIYESNRGSHVFFVGTREEAIEMLVRTK